MPELNTPQNQDALEVLMAETAERMNAKAAEEAKVKKAQPLTIDQVGELFALQSAKIDAQIQKAIADREEKAAEEGHVSKAVGRKGTVGGNTTSLTGKGLRDENPLQYIVRKARNSEEEEGEKPAYQRFDTTDKALIWALTHKALSAGMVNTPTDDEQEIDLENL